MFVYTAGMHFASHIICIYITVSIYLYSCFDCALVVFVQIKFSGWWRRADASYTHTCIELISLKSA